MNSIKHFVLATTITLFSSSLYAQSFGGSNLAFRGMSAYMGFGVAEFSVLSPEALFNMEDGIQFYIAGEKQIGKTGLFITASFNLMESSGQSFYQYDRFGGPSYSETAGSVDFDSQHFQFGLGLKFKIFPTSWFRPYGEGGGLFGYHSVEHKPQTGQITNADGNEKLKDGLTGFGYYMEAGLEVDFSDLWGIRVGARYQMTETRPFETLGNQKIKYETRIFQLGVGRRF